MISPLPLSPTSSTFAFSAASGDNDLFRYRIRLGLWVKDTLHSAAFMSTRHEYIVAYIAGSGKSGSTILDMMLGGNSSGFSTGQLDELKRWRDTDGYCTCGRPLLECAFWGEILRFDSGLIPPSMNVSANARKLLGTLRAVAPGVSRTATREGAAGWSLLDRIAAQSGKRVIIDSSKAALRLARLARDPSGRRLRVIHLVREPRGYVTSTSFPKLAQGADGAVGYMAAQSKPAAVADWLGQNLLVLMLGLVAFRGRYILLTYEQMTSDPERTLTRLTKFLEMNYEPSMLPPLDRTEFHLIGGNSSRLAFSELRYDDKWRWKLTASEKILIWLTTRWLYRLLTRLALSRAGGGSEPPGRCTAATAERQA
jgi:hypothetical protein